MCRENSRRREKNLKILKNPKISLKIQKLTCEHKNYAEKIKLQPQKNEKNCVAYGASIKKIF